MSIRQGATKDTILCALKQDIEESLDDKIKHASLFCAQSVSTGGIPL